MINEYKYLREKLIQSTVDRPTSGTLSGHSVGEPFEKLVYESLKTKYPNSIFKQYEYLNDLYKKHPTVIGYKERMKLFDSPTLLFLLSRGKDATEKWSSDNLFEEKQNDTADIIFIKENKYTLLDVKTRNIKKVAQPPNIISAYKLAQTCAKMIDNQEFDLFDINYLEIDWELHQNKMKCIELHMVNIFKSLPQELYINWSAAMQIQFHVYELEQSFSGTMQEWARSYLEHFVIQARQRADQMIKKFVKPFEIYI